ncbi:MAG: DNA gyrase subunit A, partial [Alphaproteobacteria bacterium]|nr:DNA gyrase subunit A [Alphaproteobacteria bacterium]
ALLDKPDLSNVDLMTYVPGPDFPTGGIILGRAGITAAYTTGRGSIVMRGRTAIEPMGKDRHAIIVTEVPYQVNKARMVERIAELVRDKKIEGISDLRDESDRTGVRVVIEIKRDAVAEVVLNQLYKHSPLQTSFGVQMLALDGGRPDLLDLKRMLAAFLAFREEVISRRTRHRLTKARDRGHVLVGLAIAVTNLDPVIDLIRKAPDPQTARARLMDTDWAVGDLGPFIDLIDDPRSQVADGVCRLTEAQARAILDLRLHRLTGLERDKIAEEMAEIAARISDFLDILSSRDRRLGILRDELLEIKQEFGQDPRRTEISDAEFAQDIEDLIQREEMVVTVSHG